MTDINAFIADKVNNNDVFLFMKGSPDFPQCGFSGQVVQILNYLGVDYGSAVIELVERKLAWKQQHGGDVANRVVAGAAPNV